MDCSRYETKEEGNAYVKPATFETLPLLNPGDEFGIWGRFNTTGGHHNDITVHIFDGIGLENFRNGHTEAAKRHREYASGRVTVEEVHVDWLDCGTCYVVFDNTFDSESAKRVTYSFTLGYRVCVRA